MPTTINAQNALQIREKPMEVYITLQTGSTATISTYSASGNIKSNDNTMDNSTWSMRTLADLQDGGFLLDGSAVWYDPLEVSSENNGKLGVRGDIGETITVTITAGSTLTAVTVASSGVSTITKGADTYTATGNDVININSTSATLVFTPTDSDTRVEIDYIVPGIMFNITNDTLISCTLALRGNLDVKDHTWEESEIEIQMYYPNDISSSLAYVQNDWPITYRAGYDLDLSDVRRFYLSEPIAQKDKTITIKGVDASHLLEQKQMPERWAITKTAKARAWLYSDFIKTIESAGIQIERKGPAPSGSDSGATKYVVIPEKSARDWVSEVMNLTLSHTRGGNHLGVQFVDAGIPTVEFGSGTTYGRTWAINKSDCGDWEEKYEQNIATITNRSTEYLFDEELTEVVANFTRYTKTEENVQKNQVLTFNIADRYTFGRFLKWIAWTGSGTIQTIKQDGREITGKVVNVTKSPLELGALYTPYYSKNGVNAFSNPNGLAGITVEMEPEVYGDLRDTVEPILNHLSLFDRKNRTVSFRWKGDPRMQPLDYLTITDDTVTPATTETFRITNIELTHESGGTAARIDARLWN